MFQLTRFLSVMMSFHFFLGDVFSWRALPRDMGSGPKPALKSASPRRCGVESALSAFWFWLCVRVPPLYASVESCLLRGGLSCCVSQRYFSGEQLHCYWADQTFLLNSMWHCWAIGTMASIQWPFCSGALISVCRQPVQSFNISHPNLSLYEYMCGLDCLVILLVTRYLYFTLASAPVGPHGWICPVHLNQLWVPSSSWLFSSLSKLVSMRRLHVYLCCLRRAHLDILVSKSSGLSVCFSAQVHTLLLLCLLGAHFWILISKGTLPCASLYLHTHTYHSLSPSPSLSLFYSLTTITSPQALFNKLFTSWLVRE